MRVCRGSDRSCPGQPRWRLPQLRPKPSQVALHTQALTRSHPTASGCYPETGNGGYTSVHTDVDLRYSAATNRFLSGNHVALTASATQCLSQPDARSRADRLGQRHPELSVGSVAVDGKPAAFSFVQPTYPGDPLGAEDPDPRAHEASQNVPVGGPQENPLPPACSPELRSEGAPLHSRDGTQCPADKLLITPRRPIPASATFVVDVAYAGRPGLHNDANGEAEGWFHAPRRRARGDRADRRKRLDAAQRLPRREAHIQLPRDRRSRQGRARQRRLAGCDAQPSRFRLPARLCDLELGIARARGELSGAEQHRQLLAELAHRRRRRDLLPGPGRTAFRLPNVRTMPRSSSSRKKSPTSRAFSTAPIHLPPTARSSALHRSPSRRRCRA